LYTTRTHPNVRNNSTSCAADGEKRYRNARLTTDPDTDDMPYTSAIQQVNLADASKSIGFLPGDPGRAGTAAGWS
jgi:hypothetical protein